MRTSMCDIEPLPCNWFYGVSLLFEACDIIENSVKYLTRIKDSVLLSTRQWLFTYLCTYCASPSQLHNFSEANSCYIEINIRWEQFQFHPQYNFTLRKIVFSLQLQELSFRQFEGWSAIVSSHRNLKGFSM